MRRWVGLIVLLTLLVGGCVAQTRGDSRPDAPRSLREKGTETNGGGGY